MLVSSAPATTAFPSADNQRASVSSNDFAAILAATQAASEAGAADQPAGKSSSASNAPGDEGLELDTSAGKRTIDVEDYFTPKPGSFNSLDSLPPLLLPSAHNVQALSSHASAKFQAFLADQGIPAAPAKITYDAYGQMELPDDYRYADQLTQALAANPAMERELRTLNALASHLAAMQESMPFIREYEAAGSQADADAVVAKYSYLFSGQRPSPKIELDFDPDGRLTVSADGKRWASIGRSAG